MAAVHLTIMLCHLKSAQITCSQALFVMLTWIKYATVSFQPNLIFSKHCLPIILQETMLTTCKELWLSVQFAIFFGTDYGELVIDFIKAAGQETGRMSRPSFNSPLSEEE